jgi:hypothetical protein
MNLSIEEIATVAQVGTDWIGDVLVPSAAILVSTGLAVWLARGERAAGRTARDEERERDRVVADAADARAHSAREGQAVEHAFDAMTLLLEAGYNNDLITTARLRVHAAREMAKMQTYMNESDVDILNWMLRELGIVAQGLEKRDSNFLPVLLQEIVWRSGGFTEVLTDWRAGEKNVEWFRGASHLPLKDTPEPKLEELP